MRTQVTFCIIITFFLLISTSCRRGERMQSDCRQLRSAIIAGDENEVRIAITSLIQQISLQSYTEENLHKLLGKITDCGGAAVMPCFDCIKTLPSQTEIIVTYTTTTGSVQRAIDITYTPANRMEFSNMHE